MRGQTILVGVILGTLMLGGVVEAAHADSDGYYCVGPTYLAYEFSFSVPGNRHVLHVIPVSAAEGIGAPDSVVLPNFQVHGMRCEASRVELLGWDSLYTVHLRRAPLTWAASTLPWTRGHATREQRAAYPSVNLAEWSRAVSIGSSDTTALAIRGAPQRFLLIVEVEVDSTQTCMYDVHTTVVDRTPGPRGVPKRTLFDGKADMECGE